MKRLLAVLAVCVTAIFVPAAIAATPVPGDQPGEFTLGNVSILGPVHIRGDHAVVHVKYTCPAQDTHLWVSVKQSANGALDPAIGDESSGEKGVAVNWWMSHSAGNFVCNGRQHVGWFRVDGAEVSNFRDPGHLVRGWAFVQFCLTSPSESEDLDPNWVIVQKWVRVV